MLPSLSIVLNMTMFFVLLIITVVDLLIPDPIPFIDEIVLGFLAAMAYQIEQKGS